MKKSTIRTSPHIYLVLHALSGDARRELMEREKRGAERVGMRGYEAELKLSAQAPGKVTLVLGCTEKEFSNGIIVWSSGGVVEPLQQHFLNAYGQDKMSTDEDFWETRPQDGQGSSAYAL